MTMALKFAPRVHDMWAPVREPGYEDFYEASDDGQVRSVERTIHQRNGKIRTFPSVVLKPILQPTNGYFHVSLQKHGRIKQLRLHRIILNAFEPEPEGGADALHRDDVKSNNRLSNLYWGNPSLNGHDAVRNGRHPEASKTHCPQGHPFDENNTYYAPNGGRGCRQCVRDRHRARRGVSKRRGPYKGRRDI